MFHASLADSPKPLFFFLFVTSLVGCSNSPSTSPCTGDAACQVPPTCDGAVCGDAAPEPDAGPALDAGPVPQTIIALEIEPSTVELRSDGAPRNQTFRAFARYRDGSREAAQDVHFSVDSEVLGVIGESTGVFTTSGLRGGTVTVIASMEGVRAAASATVSIYLERSHLGAGVGPEDVARFESPPLVDELAEAQIQYPLSGAVVPQTLAPMDIQWGRGAAGDVYQVALRKPHVSVIAYVSEDAEPGARHWLVDAVSWRALGQSEPEADVEVTVTRYEVGTTRVIQSTPVPFRFVRAALTGSVYYWDVEAGRVVRINGGTAVRDEFMPTPPGATNPNQRCVGCHAMSTSGQYMAGRLGSGDNIGAVFDVTQDLAGVDPPTVYPLGRGENPSAKWWFAAWSPDDTRLLVSTNERETMQLEVLDPFTGTPVEIIGTLPSGTHPEWAPDGSAVAYVTNANSWGGDFRLGDIGITEVTGPDAFGASRIAHDASEFGEAVPFGLAASYPTWSPDSARIAFAHGTGSRSETKHSALYIMNRDGRERVRLTNASGGPTTIDCFQPNFTPFESDDYYWISFLSRRDYGNEVTGNRGQGLQQVWVAAIRRDAPPGEDPSEVGYWLPGQAVESRNISAYWAPRACRELGRECGVDGECCSGTCALDSDSETSVCVPPPSNICQVEFDTCSTSSDCCAGLECNSNVCTVPLI